MKKGILVHGIFVTGLLLKGIDAVLEIAGGALLLIISPAMIGQWLLSIMAHELSEDPNDMIFTHLAAWARQLSFSSQSFAAFYLLSHGIVKIFIVVLLLKEKRWAYPMGIAFFLIFMIYQIYRYTHTHSAWLIVLTVFDIFVVCFTWAEYNRVKDVSLLGDKVH